MNIIARPVVLHSSRHCCACAVVCYHIGPVQLCAVHRPHPVQVVIPITTAPMWPYNVWRVS